MPGRPASHALRQTLLTIVFPLMLCSCQPRTQPAQPAITPPAAAWPGYDYAGAGMAGQEVFRLDPELTRIDVVVRRDGPLARFGHDHALTVQEPEGYLLLGSGASASRADLRFRPDRLSVDGVEARARYELDTQPDEAAVEATRNNLLAHVLDAEAWPWITLALRDFAHQDDHYAATLTLRVNGVESGLRQPFRLRRDGPRVTVDGFMVVRQSNLGIEPFSTLGGGLRVADPMEIHFHLEASAH